MIEQQKSAPVPSIDFEAPLASEVSLTTDQQIDPFGKKMQRLWWVGLVLTTVFLSFLVGIGYSYSQLLKPATVENIPIVEVVPTPSPSPVPQVQKVAIWNGSGKAGAAKQLSASLEKAGVTVVEVANAPQVRTGNLVEYGTLFSAHQTQLKARLLELGVLEASFEQTLTGNEEYSVRIVIGK